MLTPDAAWAADPSEYATNPEVRRIRRVTAGGLNIAIAPVGWEAIAKSGDDVSQEQREAINTAYRLAIKDASPTPDSRRNSIEGTGGGLNRYGRNILDASDAQYIADGLGADFEVWLAGQKYVKSDV